MITSKNATATITKIMDAKGDGTHPMTNPRYLATDGTKVWVSSYSSKNVFQFDQSTNRISQVLDTAGDGHGNTLEWPYGLAIGQGSTGSSLYVVGDRSNNVFKIDLN